MSGPAGAPQPEQSPSGDATASAAPPAEPSGEAAPSSAPTTSSGPRNPLLRILKLILPASVRARLWAAASKAKRIRNAVVRRVKKRLGMRTGPRPLKPGTGVPIKIGRHLHPEQAGRVPVVMVVALGLDADELSRTVDAVAWQQTFQQSFAPLFVTDRTDPEPFRRHDYLYEYVMPFEDWSRFSDPELWPDFVDARLAELASTYRPVSVTSVGVDRLVGGVGLALSTYRFSEEEAA